MSTLIESLVKSLSSERIHLKASVYRIIPGPAAWKIKTADRVTEFDAIIIASPAGHAAQMLRYTDAVISRQLEEIEYASCAVVSLAFRRDQISRPINSFGFVVPAIEDRCILSCSFSSEKYEGRAPEGTVLMRVFMGGAMQPDLLRLPDQRLIELAHLELAKLLQIEGEPLLRHLTRHSHVMPQYHVGHLQRIAEINQRLELHPTLALAGSSLSGVGVPGCIESGQRAARRILDRLQAMSEESARRREAKFQLQSDSVSPRSLPFEET
jgi:oxygen-dependent protoporphyrinogen oxidase